MRPLSMSHLRRIPGIPCRAAAVTAGTPGTEMHNALFAGSRRHPQLMPSSRVAPHIYAHKYTFHARATPHMHAAHAACVHACDSACCYCTPRKSEQHESAH